MSQGLLNQKFDRKYQGAFSFRAVTNLCVSLRQMCLSQVKQNSKKNISVMF